MPIVGESVKVLTALFVFCNHYALRASIEVWTGFFELLSMYRNARQAKYLKNNETKQRRPQQNALFFCCFFDPSSFSLVHFLRQLYCPCVGGSFPSFLEPRFEQSISTVAMCAFCRYPRSLASKFCAALEMTTITTNVFSLVTFSAIQG